MNCIKETVIRRKKHSKSRLTSFLISWPVEHMLTFVDELDDKSSTVDLRSRLPLTFDVSDDDDDDADEEDDDNVLMFIDSSLLISLESSAAESYLLF